MELLKNETEFKAWKSENMSSGDEAEMPKEFPCFVNKDVKSWSYQEERAVYFYKDTLNEMLEQLDA